MKKKPLPPRAKRMNRNSRLQSARVWLKKYKGKNIASEYRKHFGMDWPCAFKELKMLGVKLNPAYVRDVLKSTESRIAARRRKKLQKQEGLEHGLIEQDENFAYIAGYTSGGYYLGGVGRGGIISMLQNKKNVHEQQAVALHIPYKKINFFTLSEFLPGY